MPSSDVCVEVVVTEGMCNTQMQGEVQEEQTELSMFLNYKLKDRASGTGFPELWGKCDVIILHSFFLKKRREISGLFSS